MSNQTTPQNDKNPQNQLKAGEVGSNPTPRTMFKSLDTPEMLSYSCENFLFH